LNDFALHTVPRSLFSPGVKMPRLLFLCVAVALAYLPLAIAADELPATEPASAAPVVTNALSNTDTQMLKSVLQLQEQLRATQRAVEQAREQAQADARRAEDLLAARLNLIEQTLSAQRAKEIADMQQSTRTEIAAMQQSTRTAIIIALAVTGIGLLAVLFAGFAQVKATTRLTEVSRQLRAIGPAWQIGEGTAAAGLPAAREPMENNNAHLYGAIDRLQKRMEEMEAAAAGTQTATNGHKQIAAPPIDAQVTTVLAKGQTLLNLNNLEEALDQFDEALRLDPRNIEAWIKRGTALERLQRVDEAITAYDQAIAVDGSTATAYLFKAGVYNRQKKYAEALQCYEKALTAQQKARGQARG
jgi:tetratricopeptide (TPR) repeat protein